MSAEHLFSLVWIASFVRSLRVLSTPPISFGDVIVTELTDGRVAHTRGTPVNFLLRSPIELRSVHAWSTLALAHWT